MAKILVMPIKALGISQAGLPFELDVSVTLEHTVAEQQRERAPLGLWSQLGKGPETPPTPIEQQLLAMYTELHQIEPLFKEQCVVVGTSPSRDGLRVCSGSSCRSSVVNESD